MVVAARPGWLRNGRPCHYVSEEGKAWVGQLGLATAAQRPRWPRRPHSTSRHRRPGSTAPCRRQGLRSGPSVHRRRSRGPGSSPGRPRSCGRRLRGCSPPGRAGGLRGGRGARRRQPLRSSWRRTRTSVRRLRQGLATHRLLRETVRAVRCDRSGVRRGGAHQPCGCTNPQGHPAGRQPAGGRLDGGGRRTSSTSACSRPRVLLPSSRARCCGDGLRERCRPRWPCGPWAGSGLQMKPRKPRCRGRRGGGRQGGHRPPRLADGAPLTSSTVSWTLDQLRQWTSRRPSDLPARFRGSWRSTAGLSLGSGQHTERISTSTSVPSRRSCVVPLLLAEQQPGGGRGGGPAQHPLHRSPCPPGRRTQVSVASPAKSSSKRALR